MTEIEFQDYLLFTALLGFEAKMAMGTGKGNMSNNYCSLNKAASTTMTTTAHNPPRIAPPSVDDASIPKRSPARLLDRWKLPSQRLMNAVSNAKSKTNTINNNNKGSMPYGKGGGAPDSPQSFSESTSSFEIEDDVKDDEVGACLSSNSDNESVFSEPGNMLQPVKVSRFNEPKEEDGKWEELLEGLESIQICNIDDVLTFKHTDNTQLARVTVTATPSSRTINAVGAF